MRWTVKTDKTRYEPQRWCAWRPVRVKDQWVWFEWVVRQRDRRNEEWGYLYVLDDCAGRRARAPSERRPTRYGPD
jgi:hypothetical protein